MRVRFTGGGVEPMVIELELEVVPRKGELIFMGDGIRRHVVWVSHHYETRTFHDDPDDHHWTLASVQGEYGRDDVGPIVRVELERGLPS